MEYEEYEEYLIISDKMRDEMKQKKKMFVGMMEKNHRSQICVGEF